jgi:hypothetical protein
MVVTGRPDVIITGRGGVTRGDGDETPRHLCGGREMPHDILRREEVLSGDLIQVLPLYVVAINADGTMLIRTERLSMCQFSALPSVSMTNRWVSTAFIAILRNVTR